MTSQSNITQAQTRLSDNELNAVIGGHRKFYYETMNGSTFAIGHVNGRTVMVKVDALAGQHATSSQRSPCKTPGSTSCR
jgi:bacteriocin-like protein